MWLFNLYNLCLFHGTAQNPVHLAVLSWKVLPSVVFILLRPRVTVNPVTAQQQKTKNLDINWAIVSKSWRRWCQTHPVEKWVASPTDHCFLEILVYFISCLPRSVFTCVLNCISVGVWNAPREKASSYSGGEDKTKLCILESKLFPPAAEREGIIVGCQAAEKTKKTKQIWEMISPDQWKIKLSSGKEHMTCDLHRFISHVECDVWSLKLGMAFFCTSCSMMSA